MQKGWTNIRVESTETHIVEVQRRDLCTRRPEIEEHLIEIANKTKKTTKKEQGCKAKADDGNRRNVEIAITLIHF